MAKKVPRYFLAPMHDEEAMRCLEIIYAGRKTGDPRRWLASDLGLSVLDVVSWGGLIPFPAEIACGIRVRAAMAAGDLAETDATIVSLLNVKLVIRWLSERASINDISRLFSELGRRLYSPLRGDAEGQ